MPLPDREVLLSLAQDLPAVWNAPSCDMRLKQRIVRILVHEIVADVDENLQGDRITDSLGRGSPFRTES